MAACPNITLKLGGLGMPRMGFDWRTRAVPIGSEALAEAMAPWMQYCIEHFGPERCMFESNFPPDKVSFSYRAGCEFSGGPTLLTLAIVEAKSGSRV